MKKIFKLFTILLCIVSLFIAAGCKQIVKGDESEIPSNPQTENPQPETPQPENPQPENPQPETPQPENPQPENPQPENPQPENPQPENPENTNEHEHTFSEEWESDDDYHWHSAACEHSDITTEKEKHVWDKGTVVSYATSESTGIKKYKCTECGHEKDVVLQQECTIVYELNGGSFESKYENKIPKKYSINSVVYSYNLYNRSPVLPGYQFSGYYDSETFENQVNEISINEYPEGITLYAKWDLQTIYPTLSGVTSNSVTITCKIPEAENLIENYTVYYKKINSSELNTIEKTGCVPGQTLEITIENLDPEPYYCGVIVQNNEGCSSRCYLSDSNIYMPVVPEYSNMGSTDKYGFDIYYPEYLYINSSQAGKEINISPIFNYHYYTDHYILKSTDKINWTRCKTTDLCEVGTTYYMGYQVNVLKKVTYSRICTVICDSKYSVIGNYYYSDKTTSAELKKTKTVIGVVVDCDKDNKPTKIMSTDSKYCVFNTEDDYSVTWGNEIPDYYDGENNWNAYKNLGITDKLEAYSYVNSLSAGKLKWYIPAPGEFVPYYINKSLIVNAYKNMGKPLNEYIWTSVIDGDWWSCFVASSSEIVNTSRCYNEAYAYGFAHVN